MLFAFSGYTLAPVKTCSYLSQNPIFLLRYANPVYFLCLKEKGVGEVLNSITFGLDPSVGIFRVQAIFQTEINASRLYVGVCYIMPGEVSQKMLRKQGKVECSSALCAEVHLKMSLGGKVGF